MCVSPFIKYIYSIIYVYVCLFIKYIYVYIYGIIYV